MKVDMADAPRVGATAFMAQPIGDAPIQLPMFDGDGDGGNGGGAAAGDAGGDEGNPADGGEVNEDGAGVNAGGADDDDDADDDAEMFADAPYKDDPRFKAMQKKLAKQRRQLARMRPVYSKVKDHDLDTVLARARTADQIQSVLARDTKLAKQLMEAMSGVAAPQAEDDDAFDPKSLPFSTDDEAGKFFAQMVKDQRALQKELKATRDELASIKTGEQAKSRAEVMRTWQGATKAAAAKVPEWARDMFNDAVYGAFREAETKGVKLDPQRVIKHYLGKLPISDKDKAAAAAAGAQRAANRNSNLPRVPATPGVPAGSRKQGETVADVNRRIRGGGYFPR
jgi:hypothetical protein